MVATVSPANPRSLVSEEFLIAIPQLFLALFWILIPGLVCAAWTLPGNSSPALRIGTALALGPPLGGAAIALLMLAGVALPLAAQIVLLATAALTLLSILVRPPKLGEGPETRVAWWVTVAFLALTLSFPLLWQWWRIYSDNWTHAGIVRAIAAGVPPLDPGFAGAPLQYAWIYHAFVAGAHALIGVDIFAMLVALEAAALASVLLCAAGALGRTRGSEVLWTLLLLGLGLNALFPLFMPLLLARAFTGEVRGTAELARQLDLWPLEWEKTGVFLRSLGGQDFFLNKFMVATPFALSLAALTAWMASLRRWLEHGRRSELALGALLSLAAGLMHPVTGVFLAATTGLSFVLLLFFGRDAQSARGRFLWWSVAVAAGTVPVLLYTATLLGGAGGTHHELPFDLAPLKVLGYASCLALGLLFAVRPLARMLREPGAPHAWALWVLAGCAVALVSRLPGPSPFFTVDKLAYLVWIPLAITAGPAFASWMSARPLTARIALAALLFLPVNGFALASRALDPHNGARQPFALAGFAWIREHTPKDAVLLVQKGDWESAGFGERDQYFSLGHPALQLGYDLGEIEARSELSDRLFSTGRLLSPDRERLAALERPVYIVWVDFRSPRWNLTLGALARVLAPAGPKPAFDSDLPVVFRSPEIEVRAVPGTSRK